MNMIAANPNGPTPRRMPSPAVMNMKIASIGFGEAAAAFAGGWRASGADIVAFDIKVDDRATAASIRRRIEDHGAVSADNAADALAGADVAFSLVTADQALRAAQIAAPMLAKGALWLDLNSVAPETKRAAASAIERHDGRYVDVAVMAPVDPAGMHVPLLVSGPHAQAGSEALRALGFTNVELLAGPVGAASAVKMIRSVMVKGIEALTAEFILAAEAAGVTAPVIASLNASWPGADWAARANYNLDRMLVHGTHRAAEMEEAVKTLDALGTGSAMTRATVERQREMGALGLSPTRALAGKFDQLLRRQKDEAA